MIFISSLSITWNVSSCFIGRLSNTIFNSVQYDEDEDGNVIASVRVLEVTSLVDNLLLAVVDGGSCLAVVFVLLPYAPTDPII